MSFKDDPALLYNFVVEHEITFDGVESHKLLASGELFSVEGLVGEKGFRVDVGYDCPDFIVFLKDGGDCAFDFAVLLHELNLFFEDAGAEVADVLYFLFEVHKFEGGCILEIAYGFAEHVVEIVEGDEAVGVLTMILPAFGAAYFKGLSACFVQAHEYAFLFVIFAGDVDGRAFA